MLVDLTCKRKVYCGLHTILINETSNEEVNDCRQNCLYERANQVETVDELVDLNVDILVLLLAEVVARRLVVTEGVSANFLVLEVGWDAGAVQYSDAEVKKQNDGLCAYCRCEQAFESIHCKISVLSLSTIKPHSTLSDSLSILCYYAVVTTI